MAEEEQFDDMPLTKVVAAWMVSEEWEDDIGVSADRQAARVSTQFKINDQAHRLYFEIDEASETFSVFLYSPVNVPPSRMSDMARILNRINMRLRLGRLGCRDDEDANPVQFLVRIDVEGGALVPEQIGNMLGAGIGTMSQYGQLLAATALTKQSADALWSSFLEEEAAEEAANKETEEESGPSEL